MNHIMNIFPKASLNRFFALGFVALIGLSGCGYIDAEPYERIPDPKRPQGSILTGRDESGISLNDIFGSTANGNSMPVNAVLWRAALDTVSVIPIDDIDTFGGVILTEWYPHPDETGQRIKIAVFILDRELRADAVRITIYVQDQLSDGSWRDTGQDKILARRLEDLVLTRAREIRAEGIQESN